MIKSIHLKNFFSYKDQIIDLNDSNFIVGINGSGKSNLIKALRLLKATLFEGELEKLIINKWGGFDAIFFKGDEVQEEPHFSLEFEFDYQIVSGYGYRFQEPIYYKISIYKMASTQNYTIKEGFCNKRNGETAYLYFNANKGNGWAKEGKPSEQHSIAYELPNMSDSMLSQLNDADRYYQIYTLREAIKDIAIYTYFDTTENSAIRKPASPSSAIKLSSDGGNLPQILNWININDKKDYKAIKESLHSINPNITDINFHPLNTNIELLLEEEGLNSAVHVTHVSDGTLRFLCLMAILHNSKRGKLVCIDEPEVGLHPDMICEIMDAIESACEESQFIVTTHDDHLLNHTTIDKVIVCEKDEQNATIVNTFNTEEYKEWASEYSTGTLWRNGDLGGNRY